MRKLLLAAGAVTMLSAVSAIAHTNPTADQLINQLMPTGDVSAVTRGIVIMQPGASAQSTPQGGQATPAATMTPAPVAHHGAPSADMEIDFESGSAVLTPQAEADLDQLGKALTSASLASYKFSIVGHTDTQGSVDENQALSEQRANTVKSYLESKFGIPESRLQASGVGESDLLVQTPPDTPDLQNRRVQIINLGP
jgi:outer membrane protein OmpA-like peptidoglycan-associated protein